MKTKINTQPTQNNFFDMKTKLLLMLLLFSGIMQAQIVNIPDQNFKAKLIGTNCADFNNDGIYDGDVDTNNDNQIQNSEAILVFRLSLSNSSIFAPNSFSDLTGIGAFSNLLELNCQNNQIVSFNSNIPSLQTLDLSGCQLNSLNLTGVPNLINLYCVQCGLTSLNLNSTPNLVSLSCDFNQLNTLSVSGLSNLTYLYARSNVLTSLDLSQNTSLRILQLGGNSFMPDVSNLINLEGLECSNMGLTNINLTNNVNLLTLSINGNNFTNLTLPSLPLLRTLFCSQSPTMTSLNINALTGLLNFEIKDNPNILEIFLKNGMTQFGNISLSGNNNLQFLCVDDFNISGLTTFLTFSGLSGVNVSSYCTFIPGGSYNTIAGSLNFDANNNGCDSSDADFPNIRVNINDGTNQGATFTNATGNYSFYTQAGSFNITPNIENPSWFTFSPSTATIPFTNNNNNTTTQDFCITANGSHRDVEMVIVPINPARPGFDATYKLVYRNLGNQTVDVYPNFTYNDNLLDLVSTSVTPFQTNVGQLSWVIPNILPFQSGSIEIVLNVNAPTETPAVNNGDLLTFTSFVDITGTDENWSDNSFTLNQTVVGSFDPNDITCIEGEVVSPIEIGEYLHYNIRFENTGTAPAEFIVVKVAVNEADYDMNSLQIMNSSNPVYARINRNIVEFVFQNIQLQAGGHGNILLKIKSKNNLLVGDVVNKKANIYFDYNFPIETNDAETIFQALNNPDFENDASISVYPNPTNGNLNINCNNNIKSIQFFDVQGRLLQANLINESQATLDISTQSSGMYFVKVITDSGILVQKIVKE
jgi:Leucine-rich repeat (LRR) protein